MEESNSLYSSKYIFDDEVEAPRYSFKNSDSNLKIDAPVFVPGKAKKDSEHSEMSKPPAAESEPKLKDVMLFLKDLNQKLDKDMILSCQKTFTEELNKEKEKLEEQKLKNLLLEAKLEKLSEILAKTTQEKEEQIKTNALLTCCLEKQLKLMGEFQKILLKENYGKCVHIRRKMNLAAPLISTSSILCYKDFHLNTSDWKYYEDKIINHLNIVDHTSKLLKSLNFSTVEDVFCTANFPLEPKNILVDTFPYLMQSFIELNKKCYPHPQISSVSYQNPVNLEVPPPNNVVTSMKNLNVCENRSYSDLFQHTPVLNQNPQELINSNCEGLLPKKSESNYSSNCMFFQNQNEPTVSIPKPNEKVKVDLKTDKKNNENFFNNVYLADVPVKCQPEISVDLSHKNCVRNKQGNLQNDDNFETDRATQGTSNVVSFEDLDELSSINNYIKETENLNVVKFYDPSLSLEEQLKNLSDEVKNSGGTNFLHLFLFLWENIPNVSEEDLLEAIKTVKKTVRKLTGMKKESILISVKRVLKLDVESTSPGTDECSICCENFSISKTSTIRCGHTFHESCVKPWLRTNNVCPICRYLVLTNEDIL